MFLLRFFLLRLRRTNAPPKRSSSGVDRTEPSPQKRTAVQQYPTDSEAEGEGAENLLLSSFAHSWPKFLKTAGIEEGGIGGGAAPPAQQQNKRRIGGGWWWMHGGGEERSGRGGERAWSHALHGRRGRRAKGGLPCLLHQSTILWYTSVPRNVRYVGERENER